MRQAVLVVPLLVATLACSGLIPADTVSDVAPEGEGPIRTPPTGDVVPTSVVELALEGNGRCGITLKTFPGAEETRIGSFAPLCPTEAVVTWTGDRVVVVDEAGVWVEAAKGSPEGKEVPAPPQIVVFDDTGALHACAKIGVEAKEKDDSTMSADWEGKSFSADKIDGADDYAMWVHWKLDGAEWKVAEASLEADTEPDRIPVCQRLPDFPKDDPWVSSKGPVWSGSDWPEAAAADVTALTAIHDGGWRVDPTRTVAIVGAGDEDRFTPTGPLVLWVDDGWKKVHDSFGGLWLADDWVSVDDGGELVMYSRRDGTVAYEDPEKVLAFPWPSDAPAVAVGAPEPEPEPEEKEPETAKEPPAGDGGEYVPGRKAPAKGR